MSRKAVGYFRKVIEHMRAMVRAKRQPAGPPDPRRDALRQAIDQGDLQGAAVIEETFSAPDRQDSEILVLRGRLAWARGEPDAASACFQAALTQSPSCADAHFWMAIFHMQQGREQQALEHALVAEQLRPGDAAMRSMIGVVRHHQGDIAAARAAFALALAVDSGNINAHRGLAAMDFANQNWQQAAHHYRCLLAQLPDAPDLQAGYASVLVALGREHEAWPLFARAVDNAGAPASVQRDYAIALFNDGRLADARIQFEQALQRDPSHPMLHVARANCELISNGSSAAAWADYEWRLKLYPDHFAEHTRRWDGTVQKAQTLLVYAEQGMGDVMLFSRHIASLKKYFSRIVLQVPPALGRLMRASAHHFDWNISGWVESARRVKPTEAAYDVEIPLLSLMHACGFAVEKSAHRYLHVEDDLVTYWAQWLGARSTDRLRVGLVWAGNPIRVEDGFRSILPHHMAPLGDLVNVDFVSLQMDARPEYKNVPLPFPVTDPTPQIRDFADTAAIMLNLDLVLSIDTAAAHLAGAMGVPCWVLLSRIPDWRWEMGGIEQPWYGSHQSFRVGRQGDWLPLMHQVAHQLARESSQTLSRFRKGE